MIAVKFIPVWKKSGHSVVAGCISYSGVTPPLGAGKEGRQWCAAAMGSRVGFSS
jgi:hypothetical protein